MRLIAQWLRRLATFIEGESAYRRFTYSERNMTPDEFERLWNNSLESMKIKLEADAPRAEGQKE